MANIKVIITAIAKYLSFICNQSILTGIFPHGMKITRAILIAKSGEKSHFQIIGQFPYYKNFRKTF